MTKIDKLLFLLLMAVCCATSAQAQNMAAAILPEGVDSVTTVTTVTTVTRTTYHRAVPKDTVPRDTVWRQGVPVDSIRKDTVPTVRDRIPSRMDMLVALLQGTPADTRATPSPVPAHVHRHVYTDSLHGYPLNEHGKMVLATISPELLDETVVVGSDTVPIIIPTANYGRYDRGLFNFLFIPKGQWMFGLSASYGEFNSDDVQLLSLIKNFTFKGKMYSIQPTFSYFFRNNQSIGMKFVYSRGIADLGGLSVDFDDDMNFSLSDVSYYSQMYTASVFYRNYVGLGTEKRFGIFNEIDIAFGSGSSRFKRSYDGEVRDTKTLTTKCSLNFSPGLTVFLMDNVCFNVSFGVFGLACYQRAPVHQRRGRGQAHILGCQFQVQYFQYQFRIRCQHLNAYHILLSWSRPCSWLWQRGVSRTISRIRISRSISHRSRSRGHSSPRS